MLILMFMPNTEVKLYRQSGYDVFGKQRVTRESETWPAAIVKLSTKNVKTSKRTDASASGGAAEEVVADLRVLMGPTSSPRINDVVEVRGGKYQVIGSRERFDVLGRFDHIQVDAVAWQG